MLVDKGADELKSSGRLEVLAHLRLPSGTIAVTEDLRAAINILPTSAIFGLRLYLTASGSNLRHNAVTHFWQFLQALFTAQKADTIAKAQKDAAAGSPNSSVAFRWLVAFCAAMAPMVIVKPEGWLKVVLFLPGLVCFGVLIWIKTVYVITYIKAGRPKADKTGNPS